MITLKLWATKVKLLAATIEKDMAEARLGADVPEEEAGELWAGVHRADRKIDGIKGRIRQLQIDRYYEKRNRKAAQVIRPLD